MARTVLTNEQIENVLSHHKKAIDTPEARVESLTSTEKLSRVMMDMIIRDEEVIAALKADLAHLARRVFGAEPCGENLCDECLGEDMGKAEYVAVAPGFLCYGYGDHEGEPVSCVQCGSVIHVDKVQVVPEGLLCCSIACAAAYRPKEKQILKGEVSEYISRLLFHKHIPSSAALRLENALKIIAIHGD
jgi:hypothetical protein